MASFLPRSARALLTGIALAFLPVTSAAAQQPGAPAPPAPAGAGALVGTVRDSIANVPLAGAAVQVVDQANPQRTRSAISAADGSYRIDSLAPGRYVVGFQHARLDALGLEPTMRLVEVAAGAPTRLNLGISSGRALRQLLCQPGPDDVSGLVLGRAVDADTREPLGSGTIAVIWSEFVIDATGSRSVRRQQTAATNETGHFAICGIPTDVGVVVVAEHGTSASGYVELQVPPRGAVARELLVGRGAAAASVPVPPSQSGNMPVRRGSAQLVGEVRTSSGEPVDRALVTLFGSTGQDTTARDGRWALADLPAGTHTLEARVIGWVPQRIPVDLVSGRTDTIVITLAERVATLDRVTIVGQRQTGSALEGFVKRRRQGMGRFLTQNQIQDRAAFSVGDLLRGIPGVRIENNMFDQAIYVRNCMPNVWVDGQYLSDGATSLSFLVRPEEVAGVEVYSSLSATPAEFQRMAQGSAMGAGCGSIVVWTRARLR